MCTISLAYFVFLSVSLFLVCVSIYWSSTPLYLCFLFIRHFVCLSFCHVSIFLHLFIQFICFSMDKLKLKGRNLGRVFNSRLGRVCVYSTIACITKRPNFKLKPWSKQLLGSPPLSFALISLSFDFSIHPSVYMFLYLSVFLFVHPSVCMSFHVSNCTSVHLSICLFTTFLPVCMSVHVSVYLSYFLTTNVLSRQSLRQEAKLYANTKISTT
jgi:hypothetical protein